MPGTEAADRSRTSGPVVIFLHIGKTAGTTMRRILRRQFPASKTFLIRNRVIRELSRDPSRLNREASLDYFASLPEAERARPRLIIAHTIFGLHRYVPGPSTYVTLLRDPVSLTVSQYRYVARTPGHPLYAAVAEHRTLDAYVRSGVALETDNSQTRALSGDTSTPFGRCTPQMLEAAKSNVERYFSVVGLTERFDESLLLLREAFGWSNLYYVRANVTPAQPRAQGGDGLDASTRALIEEQNALDAELYAWAAERFEGRIVADPAFGRKLQRFRRRNSLYRPWGHVTYTVPKRLLRRAG